VSLCAECAATEPGRVYNVFFEVYVATADLLPCSAPVFGGPLEPPGCFGNGALDIHDGTVCDIDQYELWETTNVGAQCGHCAAPEWASCVAGDYACSPHCCTCFSAQSQTLLLNPTVGDQWVTLTGSFTAASALSLVRIHTEGEASAYVRGVSVEAAI
jgi:hypothetical protein